MNPRKIIAMAEKEGLTLKLLPNRKIKLAGHEAIYKKWASTIAEHKEQIIRVLESENREFINLYEYLAPLCKWTAMDYQAWQQDLIEMQNETLDCLKALKRSWAEGRFGAMINSDWIH
jgi:hypothetical protein